MDKVQKLSGFEKEKGKTQIHGKCNYINSADENK
jgi:hypothetical protein